MRVLVVGAGASGLVTAKVLRERGHGVVCVEAGSGVGGTFENKRYANSRMVSSKYLTQFSDFRAEDAEVHMTLKDYVQYLEDYVVHFDLNGCLQVNTTVTSVERLPAGNYKVGTSLSGTEVTWNEYDAVAVCSGLHNTPKVPKLFRPARRGDASCAFKGTVIHSAEYKDPEMFRGQRVLVLGTGETGFDVGFGAASHGASAVTMATRHGFVSIPASTGNFPALDTLIMNFGTHGWESRWSRETGFHWWLTTKLQRFAMLLSTGSSYGFNQWVGKRDTMTWDEGRKHIVNKSTKCMPLLTRKAKRNAPRWQRWLYSSWDEGEEYSKIKIDIDLVEKQQPAQFGADGATIRFAPLDAMDMPGDVEAGAAVQADIVVLATGYRQRFPFLSLSAKIKAGRGPRPSPTGLELFGTEGKKNPQEMSDNSDDDGTPAAADEENAPDDPLPPSGAGAHFIVDPTEPKLAYIGFVRPNVGAIPPMSELQAMWWALKLENKLRPCETGDGDEYRLAQSRLSYGVDYGYYMFALAREIGAIPDLLKWAWKDRRVAFAAAFGQAHVPLFRLDGPFAHANAPTICAMELCKPLWQRPLLMHAITAGNFIFFATVNIIAGAAEFVLPGPLFRLLMPTRQR
jgi:dimethylaniline monooxygenase (N-oxide forming)